LEEKNQQKTLNLMSIKALETLDYDQQLLHLKDLINQITISTAPTGKIPTIGVIAKKHSSLESVARLLHSYNIPVKYEKSDNILEYNHIKWIIEIMRYCLDYTKTTNYRSLDTQVASIISFPFWGVDSTILFDLATQTYAKQREDKELSYINSMLVYTASPTTEAIVSEASNQVLLVHNIGQWLIDLAVNAPNLSLGQILDRILGVESNSQNQPTDQEAPEDYE
jgi:hypothetical protein